MNQVGLNSNRILNLKATQEGQLQENSKQQIEKPPVTVQLPQIYNVQAENPSVGLKETVKKYDMMGLVYPWLEHPLMMLGTCTGLALGVDKFAKSCGGEYETSLVGRAAKMGDSLQTSKFVQSKPFQTVLGWGKSVKEKFCSVTKNSDVINAIRKTPSRPEWAFVRDELLNMNQRVVHDFSRVVNTLKLTTSGYAELTELGIDKQERKFVKNFFKDISATEEQVSNAIQLKRIGFTDDAIKEIIGKADATNVVKAKQLEKLGLSAEFIKGLDNKPATLKDILRVRNACKKAKGIRIGAGYQKWLGPLQPFERKIGLDQIANRLSSMTEAKTKTGRAFATFLQKCHRGFTFGGGKIGVLLFVSPLLVETMLDIKKADSNQKAGTAAHGLVHSMSWVFTFPLALSIMHHLAGAQYAGMSADEVNECRKLIKDFNEKANPFKEKSWQNMFGIGEKKAASETFQSYADYEKALKELKGKLNTLKNKNTKNQNLITKVSKQLGKFLTMDLETIKSYKGEGSFHLRNIGKKVSNVFRNIGGVPLRVGVWAGITMGVLDGLINKGIKGTFGNFYDRFKDEEHVEAKKAQKKFLKEDLKVRLMEAQRRKSEGVGSDENSSLQDKDGLNKSNLSKIKANEEELKNKFLDRFAKSSEQQVQNKIEETVDEKKISSEKKENIKSKENNEKVTQKSVAEKVVDADKESLNQQVTSNAIKKDVVIDNSLHNDEKVVIEKTPPAQSEIEKNKKMFNDSTIKKEVPQPNLEPKSKESIVTNDGTARNNTTVNKIDTNNYIPQPLSTIKASNKALKRDNYTYVPSSENLIKKDENQSEVNKYIPSQLAANITKTFDNSGLEAALRRADRAEQRAIKTLAGDFDSI